MPPRLPPSSPWRRPWACRARHRQGRPRRGSRARRCRTSRRRAVAAAPVARPGLVDRDRDRRPVLARRGSLRRRDGGRGRYPRLGSRRGESAVSIPGSRTRRLAGRRTGGVPPDLSGRLSWLFGIGCWAVPAERAATAAAFTGGELGPLAAGPLPVADSPAPVGVSFAAAVSAGGRRRFQRAALRRSAGRRHRSHPIRPRRPSRRGRRLPTPRWPRRRRHRPRRPRPRPFAVVPAASFRPAFAGSWSGVRQLGRLLARDRRLRGRGGCGLGGFVPELLLGGPRRRGWGRRWLAAAGAGSFAAFLSPASRRASLSVATPFGARDRPRGRRRRRTDRRPGSRGPNRRS